MNKYKKYFPMDMAYFLKIPLWLVIYDKQLQKLRKRYIKI